MRKQEDAGCVRTKVSEKGRGGKSVGFNEGLISLFTLPSFSWIGLFLGLDLAKPLIFSIDCSMMVLIEEPEIMELENGQSETW